MIQLDPLTLGSIRLIKVRCAIRGFFAPITDFYANLWRWFYIRVVRRKSLPVYSRWQLFKAHCFAKESERIQKQIEANFDELARLMGVTREEVQDFIDRI